MIAFFKPTWWTVTILAIFIPITYLAQVQTYAFTCGGGMEDMCKQSGIEKPALYDSIRGYPFWLIYVLSIAPLAIIGSAVPHSMQIVDGGVVSIIYYYLASCIIGFFWKQFRQIKWFDDPPRVES